jgi:hypothetical protein
VNLSKSYMPQVPAVQLDYFSPEGALYDASAGYDSATCVSIKRGQ